MKWLGKIVETEGDKFSAVLGNRSGIRIQISFSYWDIKNAEEMERIKPGATIEWHTNGRARALTEERLKIL